MSGYDYGNARLHAQKSYLLSQRELGNLAAAGSLQGLIAALIKTAYRKPIETALTRTSGLDCISESLHYDLLDTLAKVRGYYQGRAAQTVSLLLRRYDIHNLKAILRGLGRHATTDEILSTMIPVGELPDPILAELARSPDPRAAIDLLAAMGLKPAEPLLKLRLEHPGAGTAGMELALDRWYYQDTFSQIQNPSDEEKSLQVALQIEADLANLLTMLRFVQVPGEQKFLQEWMHIEQFTGLLVGPGKLSFTLLNDAAGQSSVQAAVELLADTFYQAPLREGFHRYAQSGLLSDIEKQLKSFHLAWLTSQLLKDPLGIGVLLGYVALKTNEVNNLRWIGHGINLGLPAETIRAEMEYLS
jgi:V/A-type H+-transporting ATPase subunit C